MPAKKSYYCVVIERQNYFSDILSYSNEPHLVFLKLFNFFNKGLSNKVCRAHHT